MKKMAQPTTEEEMEHRHELLIRADKAAQKWVLMDDKHVPIGVFDSVGRIIDALENKYPKHQLYQVDPLSDGRAFTLQDRQGSQLGFYATVFARKNVI